MLVRREEHGVCTEGPSFRLLRGVYFSVRARAVKIESRVALPAVRIHVDSGMVVTAQSLQLSLRAL